MSFTTREEAVGAIAELHDDYDGHCRAARAIVEQHFAAERVLGRMLAEGL
jgi:hypothetical protein